MDGGILGALLSGGATGILGTLVGSVTQIFQAKEERKTLEVKQKGELALATLNMQITARNHSHELALQNLNMKAKQAETEQEVLVLEANTNATLAVTELKGSFDGMIESIKAEAGLNAVGLPSWVNTVRAMVRPTITGYLWAAYSALAVALLYNSLEWLIPEERIELMRYMAYNLVYITSAVTLWWFGDRAQRPAQFMKGTKAK